MNKGTILRVSMHNTSNDVNCERDHCLSISEAIVSWPWSAHNGLAYTKKWINLVSVSSGSRSVQRISKQLTVHRTILAHREQW